MATLTAYPVPGTTVDGDVRREGVNESFSTIRAGAGNGNNTGYSDLAAAYLAASATTNQYQRLVRNVYVFDTSGLPDNAVISAATLSLYTRGAAGNLGAAKNNGLGSPALHVVSASPASDSTLANSDYGNVGSTSFGSIAYASWSSTDGTENQISLNASGIAAISKTSKTKLATVLAWDVSGDTTGLTWSSDATTFLSCYMSDNTGTSVDPKLVITYDFPTYTTSDSWAWSDSNAVSAGGGTVLTRRGYAGDTWAWSDSATWLVPPAARTAVGSQVTVWASGEDGYNHYAFASIVKMANGVFRAVARRAQSHAAAYDGDLVTKTSTDGVTWSATTVLFNHLTTGYDERDISCLKVLRSGRLVMTWGRRKLVGGVVQGAPPFSYSDDNGVTWSTPITVTDGMYNGTNGTDGGATYGADIVELSNGDLLWFGYGFKTAGDTLTTICCSKSTDGGATWANISYPVTPGSYSVVEPQCKILADGSLYMTYHTEDGLPTDFYRKRSYDNGVTWGSSVLVWGGATGNREGLAVFDDGSVLISTPRYSGGHWDQVYIASNDGGSNFGSPVVVAGYPLTYDAPLWIMSTVLSGTGASQNIAFLYSQEDSLTQTYSSVFFRQFSGVNGAIVYERSTSDAWAWSDVATRGAISRSRTTSDSWAWSDTAAGRITVAYKTTTDSWAWADTTARTMAEARTASDSWAWSDSVERTLVAPIPRSTGDAWAWSDAVSTSLAHAAQSKTTADAWAWVDVATGDVLGVAHSWVRVSSDAWTWRDDATRSLSPAVAVAGGLVTGVSFDSLTGAVVRFDSVVDASISFRTVV